jgi:hypothetical protein
MIMTRACYERPRESMALDITHYTLPPKFIPQNQNSYSSKTRIQLQQYSIATSFFLNYLYPRTPLSKSCLPTPPRPSCPASTDRNAPARSIPQPKYQPRYNLLLPRRDSVLAVAPTMCLWSLKHSNPETRRSLDQHPCSRRVTGLATCYRLHRGRKEDSS